MLKKSITPALKRCTLRRSHGTTAAALQAIPCVTYMNRAAACVCERECHPRNYSTKCGSISASFVLAVLSAADVCVSPRPTGSHHCGSHGATAAAFQGNPCVTPTNCVLVRACVCFVCHPGHNLDDCNPHFL